MDPFVYTLIGFAATFAIGFGGFWFAGGFAPLRKDKSTGVAAE